MNKYTIFSDQEELVAEKLKVLANYLIKSGKPGNVFDFNQGLAVISRDSIDTPIDALGGRSLLFFALYTLDSLCNRPNPGKQQALTAVVNALLLAGASLLACDDQGKPFYSYEVAPIKALISEFEQAVNARDLNKVERLLEANASLSLIPLTEHKINVHEYSIKIQALQLQTIVEDYLPEDKVQDLRIAANKRLRSKQAAAAAKYPFFSATSLTACCCTWRAPVWLQRIFSPQ